MSRFLPDFSDADAVLEYAAQLCEEMFVEEIAGIAARKKRDREDAALRSNTVKATRLRCAAHIRAFKSRHDLDARAVLCRFADLSDEHDHVAHLHDAWPLAWKGWCTIECRIVCNDNSIPPRTQYRIRLTDKGRAVLNEQETQSA